MTKKWIVRFLIVLNLYIAVQVTRNDPLTMKVITGIIHEVFDWFKAAQPIKDSIKDEMKHKG